MISATIFLFQTIVEKVTTIAVRHGPMGSRQRGTKRSGPIKHVVWLHQLAPWKTKLIWPDACLIDCIDILKDGKWNDRPYSYLDALVNKKSIFLFARLIHMYLFSLSKQKNNYIHKKLFKLNIKYVLCRHFKTSSRNLFNY